MTDDVPPPPPPPPPRGRPSGWEDEPGSYGEYPPPPPSAALAPYAAWWRRAVAILLDWLIVAVPIGLLGMAWGLVDVARNVEGDRVGVSTSPSLSLLVFVAQVAYSTVMEGGQRGATVGKMAMLIQVRDANWGGPIGYPRALGRRFIFLILFQLLVVPGVINALWPLWDPRRQALHDKAVNTLVLNGPRTDGGGPPPGAPPPGDAPLDR